MTDSISENKVERDWGRYVKSSFSLQMHAHALTRTRVHKHVCIQRCILNTKILIFIYCFPRASMAEAISFVEMTGTLNHISEESRLESCATLESFPRHSESCLTNKQCGSLKRLQLQRRVSNGSKLRAILIFSDFAYSIYLMAFSS